MTPDDFETAARAEAERRHPAPEIETGAQLGYTQTQIREVVRRTFAGAAEWARDYLTDHSEPVTLSSEAVSASSDDVSDAEVQAAAFAVMELDADWGLDGFTYSHIARAALHAARQARTEGR